MRLHGASETAFAVLDKGSGVFELTRTFHSGWALRSTLVRIDGQSLAVFSPTAMLGDAAHAEVSARGAVRYLIAANQYHHLGLREWLTRHPKATVVATELAAHRIQRKLKISVHALDELLMSLPHHIRVLVPAGLKNGEVWLVVKTTSDTIFMVGDAFVSLPGPFRGWVGAGLRALKTGPGLNMSRTWAWLHCRDRTIYARWLAESVRAQSPTVMIPCHGEIVRDKNLGERLLGTQ